MTGQELVQLALAKLANGSPADLVRNLRLNEVMDTLEPAKAVARWRDGKNEPSYAVTIRLLDGLGMLKEPRTRAATGVVSGDRLPELLEARLAKLATSEDMERALAVVLAAIHSQANPDTATGKTAKKRP